MINFENIQTLMALDISFINMYLMHINTEKNSNYFVLKFKDNILIIKLISSREL